MANPPGKPFASAADVATYVATVATELATLSRHNGLDALGYLLEMAWLEAESAAASARPAKRS